MLAIIRNNISQGVPIVEKYYGKKSVPICDKDRQTILQITLAFVIEKFGFYPSAEVKTHLASQIVKTFPQLGLERAGMPSYIYLYNQATGNAFMDAKLKSMRKALLKKEDYKRRRPEKAANKKGEGKKQNKKKKAACEEPSELDDSEVESNKTMVRISPYLLKQDLVVII